MLTLNKGGKYSKIKIMQTKYLVIMDNIEKVGLFKVHFVRSVFHSNQVVPWRLAYYYGEPKLTRDEYGVSHWNILLSRKKAQLEKLIGHTFVYSTRTAKRVGVYT